MRRGLRLDLLHGLGLVLALASAMLLAVGLGTADDTLDPDRVHAKGRRVDAKRIVSASGVADQLLVHLVPADHVAGVSSYGLARGIVGHILRGKPSIESAANVEAIVALAPDLVVVHHVGDPRYLARIREMGLDVLDLGHMAGLSTLLDNVDTLCARVNCGGRAAPFKARLLRTLRGVAADVPREKRVTGAFVNLAGTQLYGGTRGSSYHDVLTHAGLIDVAATKYEGWPTYSTEELLALDPAFVVTAGAQKEALCSYVGLHLLSACQNGQVIEVPSDVMNDPALGMIDAAQFLRAAVYGPLPDPAEPK